MTSQDARQALRGLVVDALRRSQEAVEDLVRLWWAPWEGHPSTQPFGALPLPLLMTMEQVDAAFDVAERVLAEQRRFVKACLTATLPASRPHSGTPPARDRSPG